MSNFGVFFFCILLINLFFIFKIKNTSLYSIYNVKYVVFLNLLKRFLGIYMFKFFYFLKNNIFLYDKYLRKVVVYLKFNRLPYID